MKKILAVICVITMVFSLTACGASDTGNKDADSGKEDTVTPDSEKEDAAGDSNKEDTASSGIDMSKYPEDINEWTGQNVVDYFKEAGVFTDGNGYETWIQDHATYWDKTPVSEAAGWWDDAEQVSVMILILSDKMADSSEKEYNEWMSYIKENKKTTDDYGAMPIDHLVGNLAFSYETSILDDEIYNKMDAAYQALVKDLGVTPEF